MKEAIVVLSLFLIIFITGTVVFSQKVIVLKKDITELQNVLDQHRVIKIEQKLKETFRIDDERARICATLIDIYSARWNIEWEIAASLMRVESNFDYYAKSILTKGSANEQMQRAYSLMQIKPTTAKYCADELGIEWNGIETVTNPIDNAKMGIYYYAKMNLIFNDFRKNINAYNCGPQAVYQKRESLNNWYRVLYYYEKLKGIEDTTTARIVKNLDDEYIQKADSLKSLKQGN